MPTLQDAYTAIFLAELRGQIDRDERIARIIALRDSPLASVLSFEERDAVASEASRVAADIIDDAYFSPSGGTWQ
jgi:hypothetical protein